MSTRSFLLGLLTLLGAALGGAKAQDTDDYFKQNCTSCHTIGGGRLVGPDLKNVEARRDRAWLAAFILDPQKVIDSGDAYAAQILKDARGVAMPKAAGIDRARAEKILDLIAAESKLERSRFAGFALSDRPLTAADTARGERLFKGAERLKNGGPTCISCHTVGRMAGLGGGLLGPDLTEVLPRLQGRAALGAWLAAPATPTMGPVFKAHPLDPEEILPLVAYFETAAKNADGGAETRLGFVIVGVLGAAAMLLVLDHLWRRRFTGVRANLTARTRS